jgi:hypothetical protein
MNLFFEDLSKLTEKAASTQETIIVFLILPNIRRYFLVDLIFILSINQKANSLLPALTALDKKNRSLEKR